MAPQTPPDPKSVFRSWISVIFMGSRLFLSTIMHFHGHILGLGICMDIYWVCVALVLCWRAGHGAFGIENIRTAAETGAAKAYLVSKRRAPF